MKKVRRASILLALLTLLIKPTVGLTPTTELIESGLIMDPGVSVPIATSYKLRATTTKDLELDPSYQNPHRDL